MNDRFKDSFRTDEFITIPYSEEEQNQMTRDCYMDLIKSMNQIFSKHFNEKLLSPAMFLQILVPLVSFFIDHHFKMLPQDIKNIVYREMIASFSNKVEELLLKHIDNDNEEIGK